MGRRGIKQRGGAAERACPFTCAGEAGRASLLRRRGSELRGRGLTRLFGSPVPVRPGAEGRGDMGAGPDARALSSSPWPNPCQAWRGGAIRRRGRAGCPRCGFLAVLSTPGLSRRGRATRKYRCRGRLSRWDRTTTVRPASCPGDGVQDGPEGDRGHLRAQPVGLGL